MTILIAAVLGAIIGFSLAAWIVGKAIKRRIE